MMGVAGAGMSALAELLVRQGAVVTGCDANPPDSMLARDSTVSASRGHNPQHLVGARALVISSAVPRTHPEVIRAGELGIPVIRRAEALAEAVAAGRLVGVAGTHGKTTTTAMCTMALVAAGMNPTGVVGGRVPEWSGNLRPGGNDLFLVEADEYDRSFLALSPEIAVVTSVEADHLDIYEDLADIRATFTKFLTGARCAILCADDEGSRTLETSPGTKRVMYGVNENHHPHLLAYDVQHKDAGASFRLRSRDAGDLGLVRLGVPGVHNVRNALAAIAVGVEFSRSVAEMAAGLSGFRGVERRFELLGEAGGITFVDDYAHHPSEISATLEAARRVFPQRRLVCAFQPHLFSRTRDFAEEFGRSLAQADAVLLTDIYPAREQPIPGVTSELVAKALRTSGGTLAWQGGRGDLVPALRAELRSGDALFTLGAGDITAAGRELLQQLSGRE
jgi:UDP-N-acetylmuramate--alanine ligase